LGRGNLLIVIGYRIVTIGLSLFVVGELRKMDSVRRTAVRSFEDLECWKAGRQVRLFVAKEVLPALPKEERYRPGDQIIRAARSITANIAEGYGRFHYLDNCKFCSNARGSAYEVLDHLITAFDEGLIAKTSLDTGRAKIEAANRLINGYMAYLKRAAASAE
jgi:four helix bundle protein